MRALLRILLPPGRGFKHQIMLLVSVGILLLALVSALLTAWVTAKNSRDYLVEQGLQLTESFAEQSVLALLFGSAENAEDVVASTLSFPNVMHVALLTQEGRVLLHEGDHSFDAKKNPDAIKGNRRGNSLQGSKRGTVLFSETHDYLSFRSPIFERRLDERIGVIVSDKQPENLLGFADVSISKAALNSQRVTTVVQNIGVSFVLAILILLVLKKILSRITTPLSELSNLMREQDAETETSRVVVKGPIEIQDMARAFNAMMDVLDERDLRLKNQNDDLENQVRVRTLELVGARDAAIQASKHKSAFLANMSHELRTPMNAVLGYTGMVIEDARDGSFNVDSCISDLNRVENAGKHLLSMINNILDLAKIEAGRMELECDRVDINELARQVEDTVLPLIKNGQNKFEADVTSDGSILWMDQVKLRQILVNLLSNAAKFTEAGTITLKIEHSVDALFCSVIDTGIGMDEEQQQRIFRAFKQADMTTTKNFGGTGLGLTISQRLCALMGGNIEVQSAPEKGSVLYFTLPLPLQEHQEAADAALAS